VQEERVPSWAGVAYLHFNADAATVDRIVSRWGKGGHCPLSNIEPPSWWKPFLAGPKQFSLQGPDPSAMKVDKGYPAQQRWLAYDPVTGETWYHYIGID
jgi:hypothetical protein